MWISEFDNKMIALHLQLISFIHYNIQNITKYVRYRPLARNIQFYPK